MNLKYILKDILIISAITFLSSCEKIEYSQRKKYEREIDSLKTEIVMYDDSINTLNSKIKKLVLEVEFEQLMRKAEKELGESLEK